jgi:hypothetical protein
MITLLIFSAVYSLVHTGLTPFSGTIYGGQYFVFRIFPQLVAGIVLIYAQSILSAMFRTMPFARLASDSFSDRDGAVFENLYLKSFLFPQLIGGWGVKFPILVTWLTAFTLPLQSSLFTVVYVDDAWKWATVQGVAWTLVVLYILLFASAVIGLFFWAGVDITGLLWDPRSLADIIVMISDSNIALDYMGTQLAGTRDRLRFALRRRRSDMLGYWTWKDGRPGLWYTLGNSLDRDEALPAAEDPAEQNIKIERDGGISYGAADPDAAEHQAQARYRYLPWCLRSNQLLYFIITAFVLLVALLVVSFLPSTQITGGFLPWLSAAPGPGAFSAADFLYSFLPSLLGLIMFLLFQALELSLRILQPWAALASVNGASAEETILADYAACVPIQSTIHALRNRHWRLAAMSFLSMLFLLLPVLGGGVFMALTQPDGEVRMFPNMPAYAIILALLLLYFIALVAMLPGRHAFRLPHAVTCLAEMISFLANDELLGDRAFKNCRSKPELLARLGVGRGPRESRPRWMLALGNSSTDRVLGVRRVRRFTERRIRKSQIRRRDGPRV